MNKNMSSVVEKLPIAPSTYGSNRAWKAQLSLGYSYKNSKTILSTMRFSGPLRVQRPFYPEGERCHTYLLHPPGGMVSGDQIEIDVCVDERANATITTPSAGKIYAADSANVVQTQTISLTVKEDASLEFLPQENIIFDGANAKLATEIDVASTGKMIAWDIVSFGRPHGGFLFKSGSLRQQISIRVDGEIVLHEGFKTDPSLAVMESEVGLRGYKHMGSMFIAAPEDEAFYTNWVDDIRSTLADLDDSSQMLGVTHRRKLIIVRALSNDIERLRNTFIQIWQHIRPQVLGVKPIMPRIWLT